MTSPMVAFCVASLIVAAGLTGLAVYTWRQRGSAPGAQAFSVLLILVAFWSVVVVFEGTLDGTPAGNIWSNLKFMAIAGAPVAWFVFALQYGGHERWARWRYISWLFIVPVLVQVGMWTNAWHGLMFDWNGTIKIGYIIHASHAFLLLFAGTALLIVKVVRSNKVYRVQALALIGSILLPGVLNLLYTFRMISYAFDLYDLSPLAFSVTGFMFAWSMFRYQLFDLHPVAREALVDNMNDGMIVLDYRGRVVDFNPSARRILGITPAAIGRPALEILQSWAGLAQLCEAQYAVQTELVLERAEGTRYYEVRISPLYDRWMNFSGRLIVLHDFTVRKQIELALRQSENQYRLLKEEAEAANRSKSVFLANMSHELRTPLNAILGFAQLMARDETLAADQKENLGIIERSGQQLLGLINDVLEMSKIEAGRTVLVEQDFDLHWLMNGLEEMFRLRAESKGLSLRFERGHDVPHYVSGDEGKLRQVLINLLGNAVKFTREGEVMLQVGGHLLPNDRVELSFAVRDTGAGISREEQALIFEPFVQSASGRHSQEGTGLGLSISHQFVRLMGGTLKLESAVGAGSVFSFSLTLPVVERLSDEPLPARKVVGIVPGQPEYRLLVVEDRETNRRLLVKLLESLGFAVREAVNGEVALQIWQAWAPHLIWMDMRMPVMDGYEATRRIKATPEGQKTVVVALTASVFEEERRVILADGCDDFVRKPFREDEIFERLARHLGVRFIYADEMPSQPSGSGGDDPLTRESVLVLDREWQTALYQAACQADGEALLTLVEQIRDAHPERAESMAQLIYDYRFDVLMELTRPSVSD